MKTTFGLPDDDLKQPKWLHGNGSNIFKYDIPALIQFKGSNSKHGQHRLTKRLRCANAHGYTQPHLGLARMVGLKYWLDGLY
jgi:hypothetical protein